MTGRWEQRFGSWLAGALLAAGAFTWVANAAAEDGLVRLHHAPIGFTDVIDAADGDDPFDANVAVRFERSLTFGRIEREQQRAGGTTRFEAIADHERVVNRLVVEVVPGKEQWCRRH